MPSILIISERCVGCGDCVDVCPQSEKGMPGVLTNDAGTTRVADSDACIACFTCVECCRAAAILMSGAETGQSEGRLSIYPSRQTGRII